MARIALVGYEQMPCGGGKDIITSLIPGIIKICKHEISHTDIVESRTQTDPAILVRRMLSTRPDLVHYTNYRDPKTRTHQDEKYLKEVLKQSPDLPILLTSADERAPNLAKRLGIFFIKTEPGIFVNDYMAFLRTYE